MFLSTSAIDMTKNSMWNILLSLLWRMGQTEQPAERERTQEMLLVELQDRKETIF